MVLVYQLFISLHYWTTCRETIVHREGTRERKRNAGENCLYTPAGFEKCKVIFNDETCWLTHKRMAQLFGVKSHTIKYNLN
jgi:hypothetical protein